MGLKTCYICYIHDINITKYNIIIYFYKNIYTNFRSLLHDNLKEHIQQTVMTKLKRDQARTICKCVALNVTYYVQRQQFHLQNRGRACREIRACACRAIHLFYHSISLSATENNDRKLQIKNITFEIKYQIQPWLYFYNI